MFANGRDFSIMEKRAQVLHLLFLATVLLIPFSINADLIAKVAPIKFTPHKALVKLEISNEFPVSIESARAVCFLLDDRGKVIGQSSQWVIGGTKERPFLKSQSTNTYNFVLPLKTAPSTNFGVNVMFTRIVLEGGKLADINKTVVVHQHAEKSE